MRKRSVFLILVMALASCSPFVENPQSPAPTAIVSATPAPTSQVDTSAKTYTNPEVGFSIQYPANWQEQDLPDQNGGLMHRIGLQGPEGGLEFAWGIGFGGACPDGYQPIAVAQGTWPACHTQKEDGTDVWSLSPPSIGDTSFGGFLYTNDTTAKSRAVVLQVLATLSFPASASPTDVCPSAKADLKLFVNAADGYCFLYPMEKTAFPPNAVVINPNGNSGGDFLPGDALVTISVEAAASQTAAQVADQKIAEAGEGFNIMRSDTWIGGKQAVVVDGLPAQDAAREVFIVDHDHLYILFFEPWAPNAGWFPDLEKLYSSVIGSFHVLTPTP